MARIAERDGLILEDAARESPLTGVEHRDNLTARTLVDDLQEPVLTFAEDPPLLLACGVIPRRLGKKGPRLEVRDDEMVPARRLRRAQNTRKSCGPPAWKAHVNGG